jgi:chaperone required for assembly of F1-ATPase
VKRFYEQVHVTQQGGGFGLFLDDKAVKTPGRVALVLPTKALADAVAVEWRNQGDKIDPKSMALTQIANTAIDRVKPRRAEVIGELLEYGETDLLCYRADEPADLAEEQSHIWGAYLNWLLDEHHITLNVTSGILPVRQPNEMREELAKLADRYDDFSLTSFHTFVGGFGSIVLAFALMDGFSDFESCWSASILEQSFQEKKWGVDAEAMEKNTRLKAEMETALELLSLVNS